MKRYSMEARLPWRADAGDVGPAEKAAKGRKLSVVEDEPTGSRARLVSCPEAPPSATDGARAPTPIKKSVPASISLSRFKHISFLDRPDDRVEPPISPVPLPPGVVCIDDFDDGSQVYGPDIVCYLRHQEREFHNSIIKGGIDKVNKRIRDGVISWTVKLMHYHGLDQVTVYVAVNLFDRCLVNLKGFNRDTYQLLAIASVLVASKIEEYHPVDMNDLIEATGKSYSSRDVLKAERGILRGLDFKCFGEQIVNFLDRFILAARKDGDKNFRVLCMFFLDCIVVDFYKWNCSLASLRAAAAVYCALHLLICEDRSGQEKPGEVWTATLKYYTTYSEEDVAPLACYMLWAMGDIMKSLKKDSIDDEVNYPLGSVLQKFLSRSRQRGLLRTQVMSEQNASLALYTVRKRIAMFKENEAQNL